MEVSSSNHGVATDGIYSYDCVWTLLKAFMLFAFTTNDRHFLKLMSNWIKNFACPESTAELFHWVTRSSDVLGEAENIFSLYKTNRAGDTLTKQARHHSLGLVPHQALQRTAFCQLIWIWLLQGVSTSEPAFCSNLVVDKAKAVSEICFHCKLDWKAGSLVGVNKGSSQLLPHSVQSSMFAVSL